MAKNINTGLDAEDEINTGRVKINTGIEDVNTGSTKVDTGRTSISTSSIIISPKKGQIEGKAQMVEEIYPATHKTTKNKNKTEEADEFNNEREAFVKDKVKDASSESEIGVDAIPTATKPPTIVNWKIISQTSQKAAYQIIRRDGSDRIYISFGAILKDFSRDDLIELYRLVIKKYGANRPEEMYDRVL
ncbi:hypothetical protein Tco_0890005 [Tanacetum coccineum]